MTKRQKYFMLLDQGFDEHLAAAISGWDEFKEVEDAFRQWLKLMLIGMAVIVVGLIAARWM